MHQHIAIPHASHDIMVRNSTPEVHIHVEFIGLTRKTMTERSIAHDGQTRSRARRLQRNRAQEQVMPFQGDQSPDCKKPQSLPRVTLAVSVQEELRHHEVGNDGGSAATVASAPALEGWG
jgi:hypothetical protein